MEARFDKKFSFDMLYNDVHADGSLNSQEYKCFIFMLSLARYD